MRAAAYLPIYLALAIPGCSEPSRPSPVAVAPEDADAAADPLPEGSEVVAVIVERDRSGKAMLVQETDDASNRWPVMLGPGTVLLVKHDPGKYERTQADIDRDIKLTLAIKPLDRDRLVELRTESPRVEGPRHLLARGRPVRVLVMSGEHKGEVGTMPRESLRPRKPTPNIPIR